MFYIKYIFVFLLCALVHLQVHSQTYNDKYDLCFEKYNVCGWEWLVHEKTATSVSRDKKEVPFTGKEYMKISHRKVEKHDNKVDSIMCFALSKCIVLPRYVFGNTCTVNLNSKSQKMKNTYLVLTSFDEDENIFYNDSVKLDNTDWRNVSLSFQLSTEKVVRINVNCNGTSDPEQAIWLDKISVKINGEDISERDVYQVDEFTQKALSQSLEEKYIIPLSEKDDSFLPVLLQVKDKKIIGLGECTHGSQPIKESIYQYIRLLIEKGNTKLIIVERALDLWLKYDLFVQGYIPEEYITEIKADAKGFFDDYDSLVDLLLCLRKYNDTTIGNKVHFIGVDSAVFPEIALYQYYTILLGKEASIPYLRLLKEKKYNELIERTSTDVSFLKKIDEKSFRFYIYCLKEFASGADRRIFGNVRDMKMAEGVRKAVDIFCADKEKAVLHMHSGHLSRISYVIQFPFTTIPVGNWLSKWYDEMYFPISFQIGEGEYTDDECLGLGPKITTPLFKAMPQSFEGVSLNTRYSYFYYPSKKIGRDIILANHILREGRYKEKDSFTCLRKHFDGCVFIHHSIPLNKVVSNVFEMSDHFRKINEEFEKLIN